MRNLGTITAQFGLDLISNIIIIKMLMLQGEVYIFIFILFATATNLYLEAEVVRYVGDRADQQGKGEW